MKVFVSICVIALQFSLGFTAGLQGVSTLSKSEELKPLPKGYYAKNAEHTVSYHSRMFLVDEDQTEVRAVYQNKDKIALPVDLAEKTIQITGCYLHKEDLVQDILAKIKVTKSNDQVAISYPEAEEGDIVDISYTAKWIVPSKQRMQPEIVKPVNLESVYRDVFTLKTATPYSEKYPKKVQMRGSFNKGKLAVDMPANLQMNSISTSRESSFECGPITIKNFPVSFSKSQGLVTIGPDVSWNDIAKQLLSSIPKYWDKKNLIKKAAEKVKGDATDAQEVTYRLTKWMRSSFKCEENTAKWTAQNPLTTLTSKKGNSIDCAYLFHQMLNACKIKNTICLVGNDSPGLPSLAFAKRAIIRVDFSDGACWIDPVSGELGDTLRLSQCGAYKKALPLAADTEDLVDVKIYDGSWSAWFWSFFKK